MVNFNLRQKLISKSNNRYLCENNKHVKSLSEINSGQKTDQIKAPVSEFLIIFGGTKRIEEANRKTKTFLPYD